MKRTLYLLIPLAFMAISSCTKKTDTPPATTKVTPPPAIVYLADSTQQNKNVLLEDFTGVRCGWCPSGHVLAKAFADANPGKVFIIATHSGGYATAQAGWPDYTTQFGQAINSQSGLIGYPAGTINRHRFTDPAPQAAGAMALDRNNWSVAGTQIMGQAAPVNIGIKSSWDATSRLLTVTTETYYTADETITNRLNIALTEDSLVGLQEDYTQTPNLVNKYVQNNVLRWYLTDQWGEVVTAAKKGNRTSTTHTYTVPTTFNIARCNIVAFITRNHIEVTNAAKIKAVK